MHTQVLVIYPKDVDLKDIMYWYQEVDKTQKDKINDERCQFFLTVPEDDIPSLLTDIKEYLESNLSKYYEILEYRSCHSLEETIKEYNMNHLKYAFDLYKGYYDDLKEYEKIKDLPYDDPSQIRFIIDNGYMATDKLIEFYIKGKGYGTWQNPYEIWDYYRVVDERRFPNGTNFLVDINDGKHNHMPLGRLDVKATVENIHSLTRVWEYIIFCEETPSQSELYTIDNIRFDEEWNEHCRVDNLEKVLSELVEQYGYGNYDIIALDYHW